MTRMTFDRSSRHKTPRMPLGERQPSNLTPPRGWLVVECFAPCPTCGCSKNENHLANPPLWGVCWVLTT